MTHVNFFKSVEIVEKQIPSPVFPNDKALGQGRYRNWSHVQLHLTWARILIKPIAEAKF
jgi:hypothetical protein